MKTRRKGDAIVLEFSDNGPGAREPDRVFDPFYTTRPVGRGAGLGLSACYGIIQEHRGLIQCTNRVEGGTTIHIEIPAAGTHPLVAEEEPLKPSTEPTETAASLETRPLP